MGASRANDVSKVNDMARKGYKADYIATKLQMSRSFVYKCMDKSLKRPYVWRNRESIKV